MAGDTLNPWAVALFRTLKGAEPVAASEQSAYDKWLDRTADREQARKRPDPRRRGRHPRAAVDRALLRRRPDLRLHAVLRRQRRARGGAGDADRLGGRGDLGDAGPGRRSSTARSSRTWRACARSRWSAPSSCWRRSARWSATRRRRPCDDRGDAAAAMTARTSWSGCVEVAATVLLALATVATAWSGYQASQWHGDQAIASGRATATRVESARASGQASRQVQVDVATFTQWIDAYAQGDERARRLLPAALPRRVPARLRALDRLAAAAEPRGGPDAVRARRVPAAGARRTPTASRPRRPPPARRSRPTSSVPSGTCWRWCSSRRPLRSRASALACGSSPSGRAVLAVGWAVFLGTLAWVATFPVSL